MVIPARNLTPFFWRDEGQHFDRKSMFDGDEGAADFIRMKSVGRRKAPSVAVKRIVAEIDPYSDRDRLRVA